MLRFSIQLDRQKIHPLPYYGGRTSRHEHICRKTAFQNNNCDRDPHAKENFYILKLHIADFVVSTFANIHPL